jgi:uncharacterized surface protein with fasciclin (FAS1) repeats
MKRLFVLAVLLIASSFPALAQTAKSDYKNINLVDTLEAAGNFKTLLNALRTTGLIETLKGPGPFTIFAPNDEAFAKLPTGVLDSLMKDPAKLKALLLYHVTAGKFTIKDLQSKTDKSITMMDNTKAEILCNGLIPANSQSKAKIECNGFIPANSQSKAKLLCNGINPANSQSKAKLLCNGINPAPIVINKSASVVMADLSASNGMIHVVDAVLMPPTP